MKVWKCADAVIKMNHELPNDLKKYDEEMQKKPKFDKCKLNLKILGKKEGKPRIK